MASRRTIQKHVADRVIAMRKARGLSQEALAALTTIGVSQLSKMETGDRGLLLHRIEELAAAFEIPVVEFFRGFTEKPRGGKGACEAASPYEPASPLHPADARARLLEIIAALPPPDVLLLLDVAERLEQRGK